MGENLQIICNQARCLKCGTLVISHYQHNYVSCPCGSLSLDGGRAYLKRSIASIYDYQNESIYSDAPFDLIRQHLYRGSRGPNGDQELVYIKLSEIDDHYLDNLIAYQEENGYTESIDYKYQILEREYRGYIN